MEANKKIKRQVEPAEGEEDEGGKAPFPEKIGHFRYPAMEGLILKANAREM